MSPNIATPITLTAAIIACIDLGTGLAGLAPFAILLATWPWLDTRTPKLTDEDLERLLHG